MRPAAYRSFEIVAWPAAAWGCIESVLRLEAGFGDGATGLALLTAMAFATALAARWRRKALAAAEIAGRIP